MESDDDYALEEERRLAYVGITRAMETLTLTACRTRFQWGDVTYNPVSRFISEIPENLLDEQPDYKKSYDYYPVEPEEEEPFRTPSPSFAAKSTAGSAGLAQGTQGRSRLKAVYVKPHTADSKKPYIARASSSFAGGRRSPAAGLSGLQKGMPAAQAPDYGPGDRVEHVKFGTGTVKEIEPGPRDYKVTVNFDSCGQKVMYAGFAKLKRV